MRRRRDPDKAYRRSGRGRSGRAARPNGRDWLPERAGPGFRRRRHRYHRWVGTGPVTEADVEVRSRASGRESAGPAAGSDHTASANGILTPERVVDLQRRAGNKAVQRLVARRPARPARPVQVQRTPPEGAAQAQTAAGGSGGAATQGGQTFLESWLGGSFDWSSARVAGPEVTRSWLGFYGFHESRPAYQRAMDPTACFFNGDQIEATTNSVADTFMHESGRAGLRFDRATVMSTITARLNAFKQHQNRRENANLAITGPVEAGVPDPLASSTSSLSMRGGDRLGGTGGTGGIGALDPRFRLSDTDALRVLSGRGNAQGGATIVPAGVGAPQGSSAQIAIQYQGNLTTHRNLRTGATSTDPGNTQITGVVTVQLHDEGQAGWELSVQGSVDFTMSMMGAHTTVDGLVVQDARATLTNGQVAGQAAWVIPFFRNALQLQLFAQLVGGLNFSSNPTASLPSNSTALATTQVNPMGQVVGGVGAQYAIPGTGGHVNIFIQVQGSATAAGGSDPTADAQFSFGIGGTF